MCVIRTRASACVFRYAQWDAPEPLAVPACDRQVVRLGAVAETVLSARADRQCILAATDADRRAARAALREYPAGRNRIAESREPLAGFEARKSWRLPGLYTAKERLKCEIQLAQRLP
jgi:hypothetical protein